MISWSPNTSASVRVVSASGTSPAGACIRARFCPVYEHFSRPPVVVLANRQVVPPAAVPQVHGFGLAPVGETFTGYQRSPGLPAWMLTTLGIAAACPSPR